MSSSSSSSAILSDALSVLSKTTHQIIADVEARSRSEVARALAEANEARQQRDKALRDLHAAQLEAEACRREDMVSKAAHAQAELTITHQLDTLSQHVESIAQLRREITQWKDQSKNWQDHFLRVEQERCALSSRIDELLAERLTWARQAASEAYTPRSRNAESNGTNKSETAAPTPNRPPPSRSQKKKQLPDTDATPQNAASHPASSTSKSAQSQRKALAASSSSKPAASGSRGQSSALRNNPHVQQSIAGPSGTSSSASSSAPASPLDATHHGRSNGASSSRPTIRSSTVIRRVQAVVSVKREESDEETPRLESPDSQTYPPSSYEDGRGQQQQKRSESKPKRRQSRMIVEDEDDDDESEDDNATVARNLRTSKPINYQESDDGSTQDADDYEESDEDELMMGNETSRELFGTSTPRRKPKVQNGGPPSKKRKVAPKGTAPRTR